MKQLLLFLLICPAWAQIAFVGAPTPVGAASAATTSVSYSPTTGNTVVLFLGTGGASISATSCSDSGSVALIAGPTVGSVPMLQMFYYTVVGSPTSFSCSWTTNAKSVIGAAEYSGVSSVNPFATNNTRSATGNPCSISPISTVANDYMPSACYIVVASATWTVVTGTDRAHLNSNANGAMEVFDNTSGGSFGSGVTVSANASGFSPTWFAVSVELKPTVSQTNMPPVVY